MTETESIQRNVQQVQRVIAVAAARSGRAANSVRLIAVTKYANRDQIAALISAGCHELAESRPQLLWERADWFPQETWHLVGHLQRNKVAKTLKSAHWIHSIDSHRLLATVNEHASALGLRPAILLQVNISREAAKHGFAFEEIAGVCDAMSSYEHVALCGFMGMSTEAGTADQRHREFAALRAMAERIRACGAVPAECKELSMGMSDDFEIAVEEVATMVRVGSALLNT